MQVPVLSNQVSAQAAPNIQRQPLERTVGQSIGAGLANVGAVVSHIQKQEQMKADRAAFMDSDLNLGGAQNELYAKAQRVQLKDAIGITPKLLSEFDKKASEIEGTLKTDRQRLAYREAAKQRRLKFESDLNTHEGRETEAYYAKSRENYATQAHIDAVTAYDKPDRIEAEIDKVRAVLDQTPGLDAEQRATELGIRRSGIYAGVVARYLENDQVQRAESYFATIRDRVNGEQAGRIENALIDAKARLQAAAKTAAITLRANRVLNLYASDGPEAGAQALAKLAATLPPDVMSDVYAKVQTNLNHARNAKQEEHADELAGIYQSLSAGTAGPEQIATVERLWKDNAFTPTERASLIGRIETSHVSHAGSIAAANAVRDALGKGVPLDPSNAEHRKALSVAFAEDSREAPVGSPQWQGLALAYAARTRTLPEQASSWARSAIRSPDDRVAIPAVQFFGSVAATASDAASGFDTDTKAFAGMANRMIEAGASPAKALEATRKVLLEQRPEITNHRKTEYSAAAKDSNNALNAFIDRDMDPALFSRQPQATQSLQVDFNSQAEKYYLKTGDIGLSRDLAWQDLKRVYGVSEVNGIKQVMALPPERFGIRPADVRADIGAFLQANPQADGSTVDEIIVVPDAPTLRASVSIMDGRAISPTYKLVTKTGDLVLDAQGIPFRYALPSGDELTARIKAEQDAATEKARQQVEAAREERERRRKRIEERVMAPPSAEWRP